MKFATVCSGIEAPSMAWGALGWRPVFFSEIEAFPSAVLAHHYPDVPNLGDMTRYKEWPDADFDVLCAGTPCQSFSVAGLRKGLDDPRGNLTLVYLGIIDRYRPEWVVWENVPGVLSDGSGAFGAFLGGLAELGYGFAYRVLDAQFFGVPQRRRRVFVVGCLGDWRRAAAVLFERASLRGDSAPRREAGERAAPTLAARTRGGGGLGTDFDCDGGLIADVAGALDTQCGGGKLTHQSLVNNHVLPVMGTITARMFNPLGARDVEEGALVVAHSLRADGFDASEDGTGRGRSGDTKDEYVVPVAFAQNQIGEVRSGEVVNTLNTNSNASGRNTPMIAFAQNQRDEVRQMHVAGALASEPGMKQQTYIAQDYANGTFESADTARGITTSADRTRAAPIVGGMQVRRLTPRECERLQGFPSIQEKVIMTVCLDRQNSSVAVALSCLRWPENASPADAERYPLNADGADGRSRVSQANQEPLAALSVRTSSVDELIAIRLRGKLIWSASSAEKSNRFHLPTPAGTIAASLARHWLELARAIRAGKAESLQNIRLSFPAVSGAKSAQKSGAENAASASGATNDALPAKFTTSTLGAITPICDSPIATSLCSALGAISGCIPSETLPERFSLELDLETPYTQVPYRNKPAADGPRYKALGNSMAVPVVRWIGERISA